MLQVIVIGVVLWQICDSQMMYRPYTVGRMQDVIIYPMSEETHSKGPLYLSNQNSPNPVPNSGPARRQPSRPAFGNGASKPVDNTSFPIPLDFLQKLNSYDNVNDLLLNLVDGGEDDAPELGNRFGDSEDGMEERTNAIVPKAAGCIPELQTVRLIPNNDPSVYYVPACTRIERCGGCCGSELLSCQPTQTEKVNYKVYKTQFGGGEKLAFKSKEVVIVERHTKCKCDCRIKAEDCSPLQEYRKNSCKCVCSNIDEQRKCRSQYEFKIWNSQTCICECRAVQNCTTGFTFDPNQCNCVELPERRRFAEIYRSERVRKSSRANSSPQEN